MGCGGTGACGCMAFKCLKRDDGDSSGSSYRSSDASDAQVKNLRRKSPNDCGLLNLLSPIYWFRQWRRSNDLSMTRVERTMKAAILIQRWYRRYLARMEMTRRCTWTIFQSLEYAGEQDQMKLYKFFNALLTHMPVSGGKSMGSGATSKSSSIETMDMKFEDESDDVEDEGAQNVDKKYKGIHINFPVGKADLDLLLKTFKKKKEHKLHARYVAGILRESITKLRRLPNINRATTGISKQITICGDLHGKLDDLLVIFHKNGLPSVDNPYVFNGDFVDRGKKGLEVFLLLLVCMLVSPGGVFLNRGNHEDHVMNARYGFIREVQEKYRHNSEKLLKLIEGVYRWLPLGTVVNKRVLIVHGGISDTTDLDLIENLDRDKYVSLLRPPVTESSAPGAEVIDKAEWKQVFDILWSDPQVTNGCIPNSLRGAGTYFGPDITQDFLEKNHFIYLIRSHECKPDGYEIVHNNKVITIFSASNYYELGSNKGAVLRLVGPELKPHFIQYTTAQSKTRKLTFRERIGLVEASAIRELSGQILSSKNKLKAEFRKFDPESKGQITVGQWGLAMEAGTELTLPWRLLREKLVKIEQGTNMVLYMTTFDVLEGSMISTNVVETLYRNKSSLEAIFRIIDKDNSGYISIEEFSDACNLLRQHMPDPLTHEQLVDICRLMDINKDGLVDLNEFLETFRLVDMEYRQKDPQSDEDDKPTVTNSPATCTKSGN